MNDDGTPTLHHPARVRFCGELVETCSAECAYLYDERCPDKAHLATEYVWVVDLITRGRLQTQSITIGKAVPGRPFEFARYRPQELTTWPQWREALESGGIIEANNQQVEFDAFVALVEARP
jgi:hypothetical protein